MLGNCWSTLPKCNRGSARLMKITQLNAGVIQVSDFDATAPTEEEYSKIKELVFENLIVVLKTNTIKAHYLNRIVSKIGDIGNDGEMRWWEDGRWYVKELSPMHVFPSDPWKVPENQPYPVQRVTGEKDKDGEYTGIFQKGRLDWHCNLNHIYLNDGVALHGIKDVEGTVTSWMNTKIALDEMPEDLYAKIKDKVAVYRYNPAAWGQESDYRAMDWKTQGGKALLPYAMSLEQHNEVGVKGIYIHPFNDMHIIDDDDKTLFQELYDYLFQDKFIYHHQWEVGDIVLSDQLLTQHKRQDYSDEVLEKRVLHRVTFALSNQNGGILRRNSKYQSLAKDYRGNDLSN